MRIMGLDYGSKTVGVAVSDALLLTAQTVETICRTQENKLRKTLARIEELCREYEVERIVLGFPKNMNNTIGDRAEKSLEFAEMLKRRTGLPVVMWDERLTTVAANRTLMESGVRRENRKEHIDQIAAVLVFQGKDGDSAEFYVLEQTRMSGVNYLLVTDSEEDDGECLILKDTSEDQDQESLYEIVEDEKELDAVLTVFEELLDDVDIER